MKKEAHHSRLVGGRINKQGNLYTRLVLGSPKMSRSPHPPTRTIKVFVEALRGSVTYTIQVVLAIPYSLLENGILGLHGLQGDNGLLVSLKMAPAVGMVGRGYIPRTGRG